MAHPPFHRLLAFYSNRSDNPDTQTIRLSDSIRGNLALGLDFPAALCVAIGRHLWLRNTGMFSLNIFVPSVSWRTTPLDGIQIDENKHYSRVEIVRQARDQKGMFASVDALGLWSLAADVRTGLLHGEDVRRFQQGTLFEQIEKRRRDRAQVLPLWRGGPISVSGHSWVVQKVFGVRVYEAGAKEE